MREELFAILRQVIREEASSIRADICALVTS